MTVAYEHVVFMQAMTPTNSSTYFTARSLTRRSFTMAQPQRSDAVFSYLKFLCTRASLGQVSRLITTDVNPAVRGAEFSGADTAFDQAVSRVGEKPSLRVHPSLAQPFVADDRSPQNATEPVGCTMGHLLCGSGLGDREMGRLGRQRQKLVMQAVATHVRFREVDPHGQQRTVAFRVGHVQPGKHLAERRLPRLQPIAVGEVVRKRHVGVSGIDRRPVIGIRPCSKNIEDGLLGFIDLIVIVGSEPSPCHAVQVKPSAMAAGQRLTYHACGDR